ncbi:hypothetical protein D3C76_692220 [compost metagenome]
MRVIHVQLTLDDEPNEMELDLWNVHATFEHLGLDRDIEFTVSNDVLEHESVIDLVKRMAYRMMEFTESYSIG